MLVGIGSFLGLLAGQGWAGSARSSIRGSRTPDQIRNMLGMPILLLHPLRRPPRQERRGGPGHRRHLARPLRGPSAQVRPVRGLPGRPHGDRFSAHAKGQKIFQVSSRAGDGKSTTALNLALSMAESGQKVLVIDADFRRPRIDKMLALENAARACGT